MQKGQIISLDFLLSAVLVFFAIGLVLQAFELNSVDAKESEAKLVISSLGENASETLLLSELVSCQVKGVDGNALKGFFLTHCIDLQKFGNPSTANKTVLGILSNFKCSISLSGTNLFGCSDALPSTFKEFFSIQRKVITSNGNILKSELQECIDGNSSCSHPSTNLDVVIWK